ncbi:MAG: hypothetical protein Tsb0013_22130 [Phycisphaerales bacterium]
MAIEWSEDIVICDLTEEPELSEEMQDLTARLQQQAADSKIPNVVLNLASISYLNSSNLAQLLRLRKLLIEQGGRMKLASVADPVWSIMLLTGLDKVFQFAPDKATAIASLQLEQG